MLKHSCFHSLLPLFKILGSSPRHVQTDAECTQIFLNGSRPCREDTSNDSVTMKYQGSNVHRNIAFDFDLIVIAVMPL